MDFDEIFNGLRNTLGVIFSKDDTRELLKYLDEDDSGDIDEQEFCQRINFNKMHKEAHIF